MIQIISIQIGITEWKHSEYLLFQSTFSILIDIYFLRPDELRSFSDGFHLSWNLSSDIFSSSWMLSKSHHEEKHSLVHVFKKSNKNLY